MDLENRYDLLFIGNGSEITDGNTLAKLTSTVAPNSFIIRGAVMWMRFKSDGSVVRQGFYVNIESVSNDEQGKSFREGGIVCKPLRTKPVLLIVVVYILQSLFLCKMSRFM